MRTSDRQFRKDLDRTVAGLEAAADAQEAAIRPLAYPAKHRKTWRDKALTERLRAALHRGDHR